MDGRPYVHHRTSGGGFQTFLISVTVSLIVSCVVHVKIGPWLTAQLGDAPPPPPVATPTPVLPPPITGQPKQASPGPQPGAQRVESATTQPSEIAAPNVVGLTIAAARERWKANRIEFIREASRVDPSAAAGSIVAQQPAPGAPLAQRQIRVTVARGVEGITLPNWVGRPIEAASAELKGLGLELKQRNFHSPEEKPGTIFKQEPPAGAQLAKGAVVELSVAITAVQVPKLKGKRMKAVRKQLESLGLKVGEVTTKEHSEWSGGRVLEQDPAAEEYLAKGSRVDLVIVAPD